MDKIEISMADVQVLLQRNPLFNAELRVVALERQLVASQAKLAEYEKEKADREKQARVDKVAKEILEKVDANPVPN